MSNVRALAASASLMIIESNNEEMQALGERVGRRNEDLRARTDESVAVSADVDALTAQAQDATERAEDTNWLGKLVGTRRRRLNEAEELNCQAVELGGELEKIDRQKDEMRNENEDQLEMMQVRQQGVDRAIKFVGRMNEERPDVEV